MASKADGVIPTTKKNSDKRRENINYDSNS